MTAASAIGSPTEAGRAKSRAAAAPALIAGHIAFISSGSCIKDTDQHGRPCTRAIRVPERIVERINQLVRTSRRTRKAIIPNAALLQGRPGYTRLMALERQLARKHPLSRLELLSWPVSFSRCASTRASASPIRCFSLVISSNVDIFYL